MEWGRNGPAGGELRWTIYKAFPISLAFWVDLRSRGHPMDNYVLLHVKKQMPCWCWRRISLGPGYCQCQLYLYDEPTIHLLKLATPASHDRSVKIKFGNQILLLRNITPTQDEPQWKPYQSIKDTAGTSMSSWTSHLFLLKIVLDSDLSRSFFLSLSLILGFIFSMQKVSYDPTILFYPKTFWVPTMGAVWLPN